MLEPGGPSDQFPDHPTDLDNQPPPARGRLGKHPIRKGSDVPRTGAARGATRQVSPPKDEHLRSNKESAPSPLPFRAERVKGALSRKAQTCCRSACSTALKLRGFFTRCEARPGGRDTQAPAARRSLDIRESCLPDANCPATVPDNGTSPARAVTQRASRTESGRKGRSFRPDERVSFGPRAGPWSCRGSSPGSGPARARTGAVPWSRTRGLWRVTGWPWRSRTFRPGGPRRR